MYDILLVEDDEKIREIITYYFENQEERLFNVIEVCNCDECFREMYERKFDLVLLDIMLPGMNGFDICKKIRKKNDIPIIIITARAREEDVLTGYNQGCDDYIIKPFMMFELYAKVKALINRSKGMVVKQCMKVGNIEFNAFTKTVMVNGKEIQLAHIEFELLKILMENKNYPVSRERLIVEVWGYDYEGNERALDDHIRKLRRALGTEGILIKTVICYGYKICENGELG